MPSFNISGSESVANGKFTGQQAYVAGWGSTRFRGPTSKKLLQATLSVQSNEECGEVFEIVGDANITETKICAIDKENTGKNIQDTCQVEEKKTLLKEDVHLFLRCVFG